MNDPYRQSLDNQLREIRMHAQDAFENHNDPRAHAIYNELHKAEEMNQGGHGLRDVHDRLQSAQRMLREAHNLPQNQRIMNPTHLTDFDHRLDRMRVDIRNHPHFK